VQFFKIEKKTHSEFLEIIKRSFCTALREFFNPYISTTLNTGVNTNLDFENETVYPLPQGTYWVKGIIFNVNKWNLDWITAGDNYLWIALYTSCDSKSGKVEFKRKLSDK